MSFSERYRPSFRRNSMVVSSCLSQGFTLLEVLIAFGILSVVIAALYSTLFLSKRAVDAVDESLLRLQECRVLFDTMKREIESAPPYDPNKPYTVFKVDDRDFYGKQASQLTFTTFSVLMPGLAKIQYIVEERGGRLVIRKKVVSAYDTSSAAKERQPDELMDNVESFTVEVKKDEKWLKTWDSGASGNSPLPDEMRITVTILTKTDKDKQADQKPFSISGIIKPRTGTTL